jgi:hypothetical protein
MIHAVSRIIAIDDAIAVAIRRDSACNRAGTDWRRGRDRFIPRRGACAQAERGSAEETQKPDVHNLSLGATETIRQLDVGTAKRSGGVTTDPAFRSHYPIAMTAKRA